MFRSCVRVVLAAALVAVAGCAAPKQEIGLAQYPNLKARSAPRGSSRQAPEPPPRILPETYYAAGRIFEQQGALEKAIEQYRKAVTLNHDYAVAHARLGLMLSVVGRHKEAIEALDRAVELRPDSAVYRNNLGFELLYEERWADAERHLREAARLEPSLQRAHINLGLLLGRTGRYTEALDSFLVVLPEPDAYYNLGMLHRAQGHYFEAAGCFKHVLRLSPRFTAAQKQLTQIESRLPQVETEAALAENSLPETSVRHAESPAVPIDPSVASNDRAQTHVSLETVIRDLMPSAAVRAPEFQATASTPKTLSPTGVPWSAQAGADMTSAKVPEAGPPAVVPATPAASPEHPIVAAQPAVPSPALQIDADAAVEVREDSPAPRSAESSRNAPILASETAAPAAWDSPLLEITRAIRIVDERDPGEPAAPVEPGGADAGQPEVLAESAGDQTVLVMAVSETKTESGPGDDDQPALLVEQSPGSWETLREIEISLQIIRNEVECRKDHNGFAPDARTDRAAVPVARPRKIWREAFGPLETALTALRSETISLPSRFAHQVRPENQPWGAPVEPASMPPCASETRESRLQEDAMDFFRTMP